MLRLPFLNIRAAIDRQSEALLHIPPKKATQRVGDSLPPRDGFRFGNILCESLQRTPSPAGGPPTSSRRTRLFQIRERFALSKRLLLASSIHAGCKLG